MNFYLNKYGFQPPALLSTPSPELGIIIVIPCYNESDLIGSLKALYNCKRPNCPVEVITVINAGEQTDQAIKLLNRETEAKALAWSKSVNDQGLTFHFINEENLPKKHAGVGLARKIGMDEAVNRFEQINTDGIIVCFDADSSCDLNYLVAIEKHFKKYPKTPGCSIHYEHPVSGNHFEPNIYAGIINYELHLRYYNQCLKYAGLPYAFHTVGSSMAVRSSAYQKQGGMNKRKAGEDFYFIHKIIALGGFTELKTTRVIPSPRISDRVPFGTGKAIGDWIEEGESVYKTYAFASFKIIKNFVNCIPKLQTQNINQLLGELGDGERGLMLQFLEEQKFDIALAEIIKNAKSIEAFIKRFFTWFDAFKVLKLVHFLRDKGLENQPVFLETSHLLKEINHSQVFDNELGQLVLLRELEKK